MIAAVALVLTFATFFSPWWSESRQREESKEKNISYAGLSEFSSEELQTEDDYKYVCPSCDETVAYDEEDLEDESRYYCPYCDRQQGYGYESLDDLKVDCPGKRSSSRQGI